MCLTSLDIGHASKIQMWIEDLTLMDIFGICSANHPHTATSSSVLRVVFPQVPTGPLHPGPGLKWPAAGYLGRDIGMI